MANVGRVSGILPYRIIWYPTFGIHTPLSAYGVHARFLLRSRLASAARNRRCRNRCAHGGRTLTH